MQEFENPKKFTHFSSKSNNLFALNSRDLLNNPSVIGVVGKQLKLNKKIKAEKVMLIKSNGEKEGLVSLKQALELARKESLDLVQVSPSEANPVVCKIFDYGKYVFGKKKNLSSSKSISTVCFVLQLYTNQ